MQYRLKQTFSLDFVISIEYLASVVIEVSSNLSIGPSPRITISFFILSACSGKLLSTPKTRTSLAKSPLGNKNCEHAPNPIP